MSNSYLSHQFNFFSFHFSFFFEEVLKSHSILLTVYLHYSKEDNKDYLMVMAAVVHRHSVHICVVGRDSNGASYKIHYRLPSKRIQNHLHISQSTYAVISLFELHSIFHYFKNVFGGFFFF